MNKHQNHIRMHKVHIGEEKPKNWLDNIICKIQATYGFNPAILVMELGKYKGDIDDN